ncbi:hypothetical protein C8R46DRAFT_1362265 [Mycena filopes]|nr:hypothetical protein C8R46DRAFT_1362265 [Mycena filopes]
MPNARTHTTPTACLCQPLTLPIWNAATTINIDSQTADALDLKRAPFAPRRCPRDALTLLYKARLSVAATADRPAPRSLSRTSQTSHSGRLRTRTKTCPRLDATQEAGREKDDKFFPAYPSRPIVRPLDMVTRGTQWQQHQHQHHAASRAPYRGAARAAWSPSARSTSRRLVLPVHPRPPLRVSNALSTAALGRLLVAVDVPRRQRHVSARRPVPPIRRGPAPIFDDEDRVDAFGDEGAQGEGVEATTHRWGGRDGYGLGGETLASWVNSTYLYLLDHIARDQQPTHALDPHRRRGAPSHPLFVERPTTRVQEDDEEDAPPWTAHDTFTNGKDAEESTSRRELEFDLGGDWTRRSLASHADPPSRRSQKHPCDMTGIIQIYEEYTDASAYTVLPSPCTVHHR